ncbi:hypothetical protein [Candidatus Manganitrophus noduliformans]|uniref:hypothetical protein n=1 Tax=Candidatus Manganitrophus noduliformans TaxID=2606439 RepID=UPI00143B362E|nr:hypothetical protein [Candidatus Manganitrophus noduliformans]
MDLGLYGKRVLVTGSTAGIGLAAGCNRLIEQAPAVGAALRVDGCVVRSIF